MLDGLTTAVALGEPESALKEFVAELQVLTDMSGCTTSAREHELGDANGAEHSMVDGMIELTLDRNAQRTVREESRS